MPQRQCPNCGRLGARYAEEDGGSHPDFAPHAGEAGCCAHVSSASRRAALRDHGRYWDGAAWVCPWCGTAPPGSLEELQELEGHARD